MSSLLGTGVGNHTAISERLYKVPVEYGNILRLFWGNQATEQLTNQLVQYIAILQSLLVALMNHDVNSVNTYTRQIYQVVDSISGLLSETNPYWSKNEWVALLTSFTSMNIQQATALLAGEYKVSVDVFDRILSYTNIIGDYFSEGLTYYFMINTQPRTP